MVGVILNLAIVIGIAVIWPRSFAAFPDLGAAALLAAAFVALHRFKVNILWVILAGGLVGLTRTLLMN